MKLPTDEETVQGNKDALLKVNHPCFPCVHASTSDFITVNKEPHYGKWYNCSFEEGDIDVRCKCDHFNEFFIKEKEKNETE